MALGVPQSEREHPLKEVDQGVAVFFVEVEKDLGVAPGSKTVPLQAGAQLVAVVDLAVEDDDRAVFVGDRLVTAWDVDDAQSTNTEVDAVRPVGTLCRLDLGGALLAS